MMKRFLLLMAVLLLALPALAEEVPTLPGQFVLDDLPKGLTFTVYTGPGREYHVAAKGRAKVSTGGPIQCYGFVDGSSWAMVRYEVGALQVRVGYIDLADYPQEWRGRRPLTFAEEAFVLPGEVEITDDPYRDGPALGKIGGPVTLLALAWRGTDWAYVEGVLSGGNGEPVRGFIPRTALDGAALSDMPLSPYAGARFQLEESYALNLPDDARADRMQVYPLSDGTCLVAYRCQGSDKLWMRVISETGRKLWAKSVDERYLSQITLTETGFICETFDNSECDSGMRYTYTCEGRKWASKKVAWINDPDRAYADNTASFTLLRHTFGEGPARPVELINRANGATAESTINEFAPFLYEVEGGLLLMDAAEGGGVRLRRFDAELTELDSVRAPGGIYAPHRIHAADHARNAVYFFTGYGEDWHMWRYDREKLTFDEEPVTIAVPRPCTLTALSVSAGGTHDILMETDFGYCFCQLEPDGTLLLHQSLPGDVAWIARQPDATLLLILQDSEGEFHLQRYLVCEG